MALSLIVNNLFADPFIHMNVVALVIPPIYLQMSAAETLAHFTNPWLLLTVALTVSFWYHVNKVCGGFGQNLSATEQWLARWYLLNGMIWHFFADGLGGAFKKSGSFGLTALVDTRYGLPLGGKEGAGLHVVCLCELFIMAPCCVALYYGYHARKWWRAPLEIFTCTWQIAGTVCWLLEEYITGAKNVRADCITNVASVDCLLFWHTGIVAGGIAYVVLPLLFAYYAALEAYGGRDARLPSPAGVVPRSRRRQK